MTLTIEDIARLSGFSRSTVSRVINGDKNVSEVTREKIRSIIEQTHFQPNLAARRLAAGHTKILGLVIPEGVNAIFTSPFFALLIQSVSASCNARDYSVMLWLAEPEQERRTISQILYNGLIEGVIVASMLTDDPIVAALSESSLPFVLVGRHPTNPHVNYVDVENIKGAYKAVSHLYELGRCRIATISGPKNMVGGLDRFQGYQDGLRACGLPCSAELVVSGDFTEEGGYLGMQQLLPFKPDAVFAASDAMALGAIRALQDAGLRVPQDVAIVGFDDLPSYHHSHPKLTTIQQPISQIGSVSANTLMDLIEAPIHSVQHIILPINLVIRDSCGANLNP